MKIVVIGSLNVDSSSITNTLPQAGETVMAQGYYTSPGGKGANQAVVAARLGANVSMIGKVGNDSNGTMMIDVLKNEGIDVRGISQSNNQTGNAQITIQKDGINTIVVYPGANFDISKEDIDTNIEIIRDADIIIMQLEIPLNIVEYVLDLAEDLGIPTILNPAPAEKLSSDMLKKVTYLTPNETELSYLTNEKSIEKGAKALLDSGVKNLVVTLGEDGCYFVNDSESHKVAAFKVEVVDTTAAGDSFNAAFGVGVLQFDNYKDILTYANAVAALTTIKKGAIDALASKEEVNEFLGKFDKGGLWKQGP